TKGAEGRVDSPSRRLGCPSASGPLRDLTPSGPKTRVPDSAGAVPQTERNATTALWPPKPNEFVIAAMSPAGSSAGVSRTMLIPTTFGSTSSMLMVGGAVRVCSALAVRMASTAPVPPSRWPVIDFVAETSASPTLSPMSSLIASDSGMSPTGVDVAWALTWLWRRVERFTGVPALELAVRQLLGCVPARGGGRGGGGVLDVGRGQSAGGECLLQGRRWVFALGLAAADVKGAVRDPPAGN